MRTLSSTRLRLSFQVRFLYDEGAEECIIDILRVGMFRCCGAGADLSLGSFELHPYLQRFYISNLPRLSYFFAQVRVSLWQSIGLPSLFLFLFLFIFSFLCMEGITAIMRICM